MLFVPFPPTAMDIEESGGFYLCSDRFSLEKIKIKQKQKQKQKTRNQFCEIVTEDQKGQYLTLYNDPNLVVFVCERILPKCPKIFNCES